MQVEGNQEEATNKFLEWVNTQSATPIVDFNERYLVDTNRPDVPSLKDGVALAHLVNVLQKDKFPPAQILKLRGKKLVQLAVSAAIELGVSSLT